MIARTFKHVVGLSGIASAALALAVTPAFAASEQSKAGMPQFDPSGFAPQIVWLAITFIALYLVMSKVALPRIAEVLQDRARRVEDNLAKAEALTREAEAAREAYEKAVAESRSRAAALTTQAADRAAKEAAAQQQALAARLAEQGRETEERIASARAQALASTQVVAAEVARAAVRKLLGREIDEATAQAAVKAVAARVQ